MKRLQKYVALFLVLILFSLIIAGCTTLAKKPPAVDRPENPGKVMTPESPDGVVIIPSVIDTNELAEHVPIPLEKADQIVKEFAEALNEGDAIRIFDCMTFPNNNYYTIDWTEAAVKNYHIYFHGEPIEKAELVGPAEYHQGLVYRLYSAGSDKEVFVNACYIDGEYIYEDLIIYDNILFYSYRAEQYLEAFFDAMKQNKPETISSLLTYDDFANPYPESKALDIIAHYEASFDTQTLEFIFAGTETRKADEGNLVYVITGTREGVPAKHEIMLCYGDGLVGLIDDWIP